MIAARFKLFPFAVMTLHAESGTGADVWSLIRYKQSFILGGDLNCTPDELRGRHSSDFNNSNGRFVISAPSSATHEHGSELDYFIHAKGIICKNTKIADSSGGSDHYPVLTEAYRA